MLNLQFLSDYSDEFIFEKNTKQEREIRLETSVKFTVRFADKDHLVVGDALITIQDSGHEGLFRIKFHHLSQFRLDSPVAADEEKKEVHMTAAGILQPIWNRMLRSFCATVGIPIIQLPAYAVSEDRIKTSS